MVPSYRLRRALTIARRRRTAAFEAQRRKVMNRFGQVNWNTWRHTGTAADLLAVSPHTRSHRFRVRQSLTYSISIRYCRPGAFETYVAPSGAARYFRETGGLRHRLNYAAPSGATVDQSRTNPGSARRSESPLVEYDSLPGLDLLRSFDCGRSGPARQAGPTYWWQPPLH